MATYTLTTGTVGSPLDIAAQGTRATGDIYNLNGCYALWDVDSRYGLGGAVAASCGNIVGSASLGGTIEFNSTKVRLIPFTGGSGNVPAADTVISQGSASGKLIGVYSALNVAPTAAASAMPASGYIKIRAWNSVSYAAGALTGLTATASAADGPGWIEVVGVDASLITINRLNLFKVRGDWYTFQGATTTGTRTSTYQIPTNGSAVNYFPGVEVETGVGTGIYEYYPCAGTMTALAANIATDWLRGRWCWVSATTGMLMFGYDGTNSTGGYCPPSGLRIRIPNIFFVCCIAAASVNVLPNATLATRQEFATTGGGVLDIDKCCMSWYMNINQPFSVALSNIYIFEAMILTECASPIAWSNVGIGQTAANTQIGLTMSLDFAGGTMDKCTWTRAAQAASGAYVTSWADSLGFTITNERNHSLTKAANAATGSHTLTRVADSTWTNTTLGGGRVFKTTCTDVLFTNTTYYDHPSLTTGSAIPMYVFDIGTNCLKCYFDGINHGGLPLVQPYSGYLNVGTAGCTDIKLRNLGTYASPLDAGAAQINGTWTRSSTTVTVTTATPHGLKTGDYCQFLISSDSTAATLGNKAVTVSSTTIFTYTGANAGLSSGTVTFYPTMAAVLINLATGAAANNVKVQRCYTPHLRTGLIGGGDNSTKNVLLESVWGIELGALLAPELNLTLRGITATPALTAQTSVYGTHWFDHFTTNGLICTGKGYTQATTTATITSVGHGLRTGDLINVTYSSNTAIIILGQKTVTCLTADTFTFACLTGSTTGTIDYTPLNGRVAIQMNEPTADTSSQVSLTGGAAFTSAGGLYMPVIGQQVDFISPTNIKGHSAFPIAEAVMAGGTIANYDIKYSLDGGATYHNLYYPRAGGSGSSAAYTFTVTNATGVEIGDYVWGTNIGYNARVTNVSSNTITVNVANIGTVSGVIRFNHLPFETVSDASVGFPLKLRITTSTTNSTAITSLYFFTYSTPTTRAYTYTMDVSGITVNGLVTDSRVKLSKVSDGTVLATGLESGGSVGFNIDFSGALNIEARKGSSSPYYLPWVTQVQAVAGSTVTATALQVLDE